MTLHLSRVLEECQPRIAIMTGICAGDAQQVHLGDLVVAERTFTYDNGKFTLDEHGRAVHLHNTMTYQLDDQDMAQKYEGREVKVNGTVDSTTSIIHVNDLTPVTPQ